MKCVILLRGINVGDNNIIKMADLRKAFERNDYKNVVTFLQSENVIFDPPTGGEEKDVAKIAKKNEKNFVTA